MCVARSSCAARRPAGASRQTTEARSDVLLPGHTAYTVHSNQQCRGGDDEDPGDLVKEAAARVLLHIKQVL